MAAQLRGARAEVGERVCIPRKSHFRGGRYILILLPSSPSYALKPLLQLFFLSSDSPIVDKCVWFYQHNIAARPQGRQRAREVNRVGG
jgi:hypothetical protein